VATVELVAVPVDGDYLHHATLENMRLAENGAGVLGHTFGATVTNSDRVVLLPALRGLCPDGAGGLVYFTYAGGTLTHDVGDALPRVDIGVWDASGAAPAIVKGTATAETGDVAEAPEPALSSDQIMLYRVRIPASASTITAANTRGRAIDVSENGLNALNVTEATMTAAAAADMVTLAVAIPALRRVRITGSYRKSASAAQPALGLKVNSTVVVEAIAAAGCATFSNTNEAQNGVFEILLGPQRANYDRGLLSRYHSGGATGGASGFLPSGVQTAALPIAAITSIVIRGISDGAATLGVFDVAVFVE
jgi:hypothetical protein